MPINSAALQTFLKSRRSVRRFKPDPVPEAVINEILCTATFAPSAHNRQPWRFVAISDASVKSSLASRMTAKFREDLVRDQLMEDEIEKRINRSHERVTNAPLVILLALDMSDMDEYQDTRRKKAEHLLAVQSAANAGLQLLLAAHAEGLGGVWLSSPMFAQNVIRRELNLPRSWEPQALFLLGYPDQKPEPRTRKPVEDITMKVNSQRTSEA